MKMVKSLLLGAAAGLVALLGHRLPIFPLRPNRSST